MLPRTWRLSFPLLSPFHNGLREAPLLQRNFHVRAKDFLWPRQDISLLEPQITSIYFMFSLISRVLLRNHKLTTWVCASRGWYLSVISFPQGHCSSPFPAHSCVWLWADGAQTPAGVCRAGTELSQPPACSLPHWLREAQAFCPCRWLTANTVQ